MNYYNCFPIISILTFFLSKEWRTVCSIKFIGARWIRWCCDLTCSDSKGVNLWNALRNTWLQHCQVYFWYFIIMISDWSPLEIFIGPIGAPIFVIGTNCTLLLSKRCLSFGFLGQVKNAHCIKWHNLFRSFLCLILCSSRASLFNELTSSALLSKQS